MFLKIFAYFAARWKQLSPSSSLKIRFFLKKNQSHFIWEPFYLASLAYHSCFPLNVTFVFCPTISAVDWSESDFGAEDQAVARRSLQNNRNAFLICAKGGRGCDAFPP